LQIESCSDESWPHRAVTDSLFVRNIAHMKVGAPERLCGDRLCQVLAPSMAVDDNPGCSQRPSRRNGARALMIGPARSIGPIPLLAIFGMRKHAVSHVARTDPDFATRCRPFLNACGGHLRSLARDVSATPEGCQLSRGECAGGRWTRAAPRPLQLSRGDG
jgi:hypothetical protein